jgi:hypothetical protein
VRTIGTFALVLFALATALARADDKPTSLSDARAAVDANLKTPEGKDFDERLGKDFFEKHMGPLRQCKQSAGNDLGSFWISVETRQRRSCAGGPVLSDHAPGNLRERPSA